jgi:hypothetical protein
LEDHLKHLCLVIILLAGSIARAADAPPPKPAVSQGKDGKLSYVADDRGNRVPDFSYCGYMGGTSIPDVGVVVVVSPVDGDNTARIQSAIDYVGSRTVNVGGFRGAVLLEPGRFEVNGGLRIGKSGVVLRGSGVDRTTLVATGQDRRTLITIAGAADQRIDAAAVQVADAYVPVGAMQVRVGSGGDFKAGDTVVIRRPCTAEWIKALGMDNMGGDRHGFAWKPGTRELAWDRTVTAVHGDTVTLDAPLTTAIENDFGGGTVARYEWSGRIDCVGVENLRCESAFDPAQAKDENHAWLGVGVENAQDVWVRRVTVAHFAGSAVSVLDSCKHVTVEDCKSLEPVSEVAGYRRHTFFTNGQQTLVQRCYSEEGRHDFAVGVCAAGPNAFVQCEAKDALDDSGPIDSWASGVLFDNVRIDGNALDFGDRRFRNAGAGWSAANCMLWQCSAAVIRCWSPPTATNWAIGCWATFDGNGQWAMSNESINPFSLYYAQLSERLGAKVAQRADLLQMSSDASSSPSPAEAAELIAASTKPATTLSEWIDGASRRRPLSTDAAGAKRVDELPSNHTTTSPTLHPIRIERGQIVCDGAPLTGARQAVAWWQGGVRPADLVKPKPCITRYVPGRIGPGLTDDLVELVDGMVRDGVVAMEHNYGLWYDRRNDDHERVRRMDGDAWPPFYELPFARSGTGVAWDGLSKYDLTKYNPWYFDRLSQFAALCDQRGLVLINHQFFQHNILEAGAHWASCPWRTANNINGTGFPEPPPYAGDKRIFLAEQFYDVGNATRRAIYRGLIRKNLDALSGSSNVIHLTAAEFTGPLHFMQFWVDTVAEWEKETGKHPLIGLSATKDVQDAILSDAKRAAVIDVIDIRYWWYQTDGKSYAPPGGQNLAPRQQLRVYKPKGPSAGQVARAVREYREKYPDKAVIYSVEGAERLGQAAFDAGASLADAKRGSQ